MGIERCKIGLYEKALPARLSWEERLTAAARAGYDFLEISIDETDERMGRLHWTEKQSAQVLAAMRASGTPILTMCLSGNRRYPIGSEDPQCREKGIRLIKDAVDFSVGLGVRVVQLASYDEYYGARNATTESLFFDSLCEVVEYAAGCGVTLAFETMDTPFVDTIEKAMRFVRKLDSPFLQIYPDVGNLAALGMSMDQIARDFQAGQGHIVAIHLKDARRGIIRNIPYGEGIVDFAAFFSHLRRVRYAGLLVAEMWTDETDASTDYVKTARDYLLEQMGTEDR